MRVYPRMWYDDDDDDEELFLHDEGLIIRLGDLRDRLVRQGFIERNGDDEPVERAQQIEEARRLKQAGLPHLDVPTIEPEFGRFFNDPTYSDTTLLVGTHSFHAHRLILSSWSSVLKDILKTSEEDLVAGSHAEDPGMRTYRLDQDPDCSEVFGTFLKFLYTNAVTFTEDNIMPLLQMSNTYEIDELNKLCDSYIGDLKMDASSAISVLIQAMKYKMAHTIQSCISVLRSNFELLHAEQLQVLDSSLIIALLDCNDQSLVVKDEFTLLQKLIPWLTNCTDDETFKTVVGHIRFPFMSALQLKAVGSSDIMRRLEEVIPAFLVDALKQHSLYREGFADEILQPVLLPRLYLNPPVALFGHSEGATTGKKWDEEGFMEFKVVESTYSLLQNVLVNGRKECTPKHYKIDDCKEWFIDVKRIHRTFEQEHDVLCGLNIGIIRKIKHYYNQFYPMTGARVQRAEESYRGDQVVEVAVQVKYEDGSDYVFASRRPLLSKHQDQERGGETNDVPLFTFETPCTIRSLTAKVKVRVSVVIHRSPESQSKDK
eukprot:XP_011672187.1 PREDICTED: uncharacterized protein LOC105442080 isoform X2 [Strongylocentrotus purpuratus]